MDSEDRRMSKADLGGDPPYPNQTYAWYVVGVLTLAYTVSFVDRQILGLLVGPLRDDLNISDTGVSLLGGLAFALFYTVMGIPIARIADRRSRRLVIAVGIFMWSIMTAACGLARNFWQLFAARMGVGVGEAALSPSAYSMINDYFPPHLAPRAISIYSAGISLGAGLAYIVGGGVIALVENSGPIILPFLGEVKSWQVTFFAVGAPGLVIVALMATVREPMRRGRLAATSGNGGGPAAVPLRQVLSFMVKRWRALASHSVGFSLLSMLGYGTFFWYPTFFIRTYGWSASEIGLVYGLIILVFGSAGAVSAGWFAEAMARRGHPDAIMRLIMYASILVMPIAIAAPLMPTPFLSLLLIAPATFILSMWPGLAPAALQPIAPNQMRAQVSAVYLFVLNIMGLGLGPTMVATITDYVFADDMAIGYSLALTAAITTPVAALILGLGLRPYRRCVEMAKAWTAPQPLRRPETR